MDGWMDGQMDGRRDGRVWDRKAAELTKRHTDRQYIADRQRDESCLSRFCLVGIALSFVARPMDRQMDEWMD